jgi:hypothetical protein
VFELSIIVVITQPSNRLAQAELSHLTHFAGFSFVFLRSLAQELRLKGVLDIDVFFLELGAIPTVTSNL